MASRTSTPQSRSRSASGSSSSSDTTMMDAPPQTPSRPVRLRNPSQSLSSPTAPVFALFTTAPPNPSFSLLLSLPRELRDRVYAYALTSQAAFSWPGKVSQYQRHNVNVALLRTNRQVFDEAAPLLYSLNKFLFLHPSDCNIFRVVTSSASQHIASAHFRIREKDLRLWTSYLGSKSVDRSLRADLPKLKNLWIYMRCGSMGNLGQLGGGAHGHHGLPPGVQVQVQAVQNALGQQVQALQQQLQSLTQAMGNNQHTVHVPPLPQQQQPMPPTPQITPMHSSAPGNLIPPPPPPPPAIPFLQFAQTPIVPHQHPQPAPHGHVHPHAPVTTPTPQPHPHPLYSSFLRFEREMGLESLCLSLHDTLSSTSTEVKIVCIMKVPRREVVRLAALHPDELEIAWDSTGPSARTRFRKLHGVEVGIELSGYEASG